MQSKLSSLKIVMNSKLSALMHLKLSSCHGSQTVKKVKKVKLSRQSNCQESQEGQTVQAVKLSRQSNCQGNQVVIAVMLSRQSVGSCQGSQLVAVKAVSW